LYKYLEDIHLGGQCIRLLPRTLVEETDETSSKIDYIKISWLP